MISRLAVILLAFLATSVVPTHPQERARGRVIASDGSPLPGVRVVVGGTRSSTLTDDRGEYSLDLPPGARTLVFRSIGFSQDGEGQRWADLRRHDLLTP